MNTNEPTMDAATLIIAGKVIDQTANEMNMDDTTQDFRDGYRSAGQIMSSYGMLLALGFSMDDLSDIAKKKLANNERAQADELKRLLGDG